MMVCEGIIHFDAVLCRGPRHSLTSSQEGAGPPLRPSVATVALGPEGCGICKTSPEGHAVFGQSPSHQLPLLAPPPFISPTIRAAQIPSSDFEGDVPMMIARCVECVRNRWCERCHKWWCESCFEPNTGSRHGQQVQAPGGSVQNQGADAAFENIENVRAHIAQHPTPYSPDF